MAKTCLDGILKRCGGNPTDERASVVLSSPDGRNKLVLSSRRISTPSPTQTGRNMIAKQSIISKATSMAA